MNERICLEKFDTKEMKKKENVSYSQTQDYFWPKKAFWVRYHLNLRKIDLMWSFIPFNTNLVVGASITHHLPLDQD